MSDCSIFRIGTRRSAREPRTWTLVERGNGAIAAESTSAVAAVNGVDFGAPDGLGVWWLSSRTAAFMATPEKGGAGNEVSTAPYGNARRTGAGVCPGSKGISRDARRRKSQNLPRTKTPA